MKRFTSILLALVILMTLSVTAFAETTAEPYIRHIYGGNNKGETPISNSFVELYNPADSAVDLNGYSMTDGNKTIKLTGIIPANSSYLIVGAAETTTDEYLTYDLPTADMVCDWVISNKSYNIKLLKGESEIDSVTAGSTPETKISKQKSLKRSNDGTFELIVWEKASVAVDDNYVAVNAPRNSKGEYGSAHKLTSNEPDYTPVTAGEVRVNGYYDNDGSLKMELVGRYNSEAMCADGGSLEIVAYNRTNGYAYAVSGIKGKLIAVDLNNNMDSDKVVSLNGTEYDVKSLVSGFTYGDITSVAVSPNGKMLAVAIQAVNYSDKGIVAIFACENDGSLNFVTTAKTGVQPDMVIFADNNTVLTADEGEPRNGKNGVDPKGSVTIAKFENDGSLTSKQIYFDEFDAKRENLTNSGVLVQKDKNPSADFEPEYIAVSGNIAYVSLQEANAIAVLDISKGEFTGIYPLGLQDFGEIKVDLQKNEKIDIKNYENVFGIKMPDGIAVTDIGGKTYLLTANEGDSRADWQGLDNEYESVTSPTGNVTLDKKVVWFNAAMWDGLDTNKAYVFGGRSFSIYEVTGSSLSLVYDSGSDFEEITAKILPDFFNASNDKISLDNRSGKKGPEPESVIVGNVGEKTYAFIALERIGGIMVYDITKPDSATFVNYINSREFDAAIQGDVSPEGLCFIPSIDSKTGKALLLTACEVSGTLAVYECAGSESELPSAKAPSIINGANDIWTLGSKDGLTVICDADLNDFVGLSVDGKAIDGKHYTVEEGSTVIILKPEFLSTLSIGKHTLSINFTTGLAETKFEIKQSDLTNTETNTENTESGEDSQNTGSATSPCTKDNTKILLWFILLIVSGSTLAKLTVNTLIKRGKNI